MAGDEGYDYVGCKYAEGRLSNSWYIRNFVRAVVFNNNIMLVNLNRGENTRLYMEHQAKYGENFLWGWQSIFQCGCCNIVRMSWNIFHCGNRYGS